MLATPSSVLTLLTAWTMGSAIYSWPSLAARQDATRQEMHVSAVGQPVAHGSVDIAGRTFDKESDWPGGSCEMRRFQSLRSTMANAVGAIAIVSLCGFGAQACEMSLAGKALWLRGHIDAGDQLKFHDLIDSAGAGRVAGRPSRQPRRRYLFGGGDRASDQNGGSEHRRRRFATRVREFMHDHFRRRSQARLSQCGSSRRPFERTRVQRTGLP